MGWHQNVLQIKNKNPYPRNEKIRKHTPRCRGQVLHTALIQAILQAKGKTVENLKKFPTVVLIGFTVIWKSSKQQLSKYAQFTHMHCILKGRWTRHFSTFFLKPSPFRTLAQKMNYLKAKNQLSVSCNRDSLNKLSGESATYIWLPGKNDNGSIFRAL